jgi:hypothetical protein
MSEDWQEIETASKNGTPVRLWCPGVGPYPEPFECVGRFNGVCWASVGGDRPGALVPGPQKWKPLSMDAEYKLCFEKNGEPLTSEHLTLEGALERARGLRSEYDAISIIGPDGKVKMNQGAIKEWCLKHPAPGTAVPKP